MAKNKKDYTVKKINIERDFADEVFKKYKYNRYGVGSCCTSNYTSKLNTKYICDYQDSEIFRYSKKVTTTTKYTVPTEGALDDADRPAWVDALCGMASEDVQIYCYYDASSLAADDVLKAYQAVKQWINSLGGEDNSLSTCPSPQGLIQDFHTSVAGERWLDWAIQPITGVFNNSGSCGGVDSGCNTNTPPVDFGPCVQATFSDAVLPSNVNSKMWQTLKLFENNNLTIYNSGGAGANVTGVNALTNPTIGLPPSATAKNVLVIVFADESAQGSTDGSVAQPYHNLSNIVPPAAMTWAAATIGTGTAADGADATLTPCWKADHQEFVSQRNTYLSQNPTHQYKCFLYPTRPTTIQTTHRPFGLHALGAITSGNGPTASATATVTFTSTGLSIGQTIQIVSTTGITKTYTAGAAENLGTNTFNANANGLVNVALSLKACIEDAAGHNGQINVVYSINNSFQPVLTLTQTAPGGLGNTTITSNLTNVTVTNFTGGSPNGTFTPDNTLPNNGAPFCSLSNLENITLGNPYYSQGYGALDQHGWGIDVSTSEFEPQQFADDINEFADVTTCQDTECLLFVISDQNGNRVEGYEIIWNGGVIGETDENGLFRYCVENASIDNNHIFDLCTCITTTGNCNSQKISVTVTDDTCVEDCPDRPHEQCYVPPVISSGNENKGCTDPTACNYNPYAANDDGSCTYCCTFFASLESKTDATNDSTDDGAINITVGGGVGPYTFQWFKNGTAYATTQNLSGLGGGVYSVVITDSSTNPPCITQLVVNIDAPPTIIFGCTNNLACNYNAAANQDDGSCLFKGCTDPTALDYDPAATADCNCNPPTSSLYQNDTGWDACCTPCVFGCMDSNANNYNANATCDDGSCTYNYNCVEVPGSGVTVNYLDSSLGEDPTVKGIAPCLMDASGEQAAYYNGLTDRCSTAVNVGTGPFDNADDMLQFLTTESSWTSNLSNGTDITQYILPYDLNAGYNPDCPVCDVPPAPPGVLNTAPANPVRITWNFLYNWATLIPNSTQQPGGNYAYKHYTDISELYNDINILLTNNTITLSIGGSTISSVGSFTGSGPAPGTFNTNEINQAFANAPYTYNTCSSCPNQSPNITMDFTLCQCTVVQDTQCECQEMFDGTGVYPTISDCTNALTCCNDNPPELPWECTFSSITDTCQNLEVFSNVVAFPNDTAAVNGWTSSAVHLNNPNMGSYKFLHLGTTGTCAATTLGGTPAFWKRYNYIELSVFDPNISGFVTIGIVGNGWSWFSLLNYMFNAGLNGTGGYPDVSGGATYTQIKNIIDTNNGPGQLLSGYQIHFLVSDCDCEYTDCQCIQSPNGTYALEADCTAVCCGGSSLNDVPGCTQQSAANYNPGATVDDGSCYVCSPAPSDFVVVGSVGVINYTADTSASTDPSAYNVADGSVVIQPTTFINGQPIPGSLQNYTASLYGSTNGQGSPLVSNQTFQNVIDFVGLEADAYTVIFSHIDYPECTFTVQVSLANAIPQIKYKCEPGDLVDSTEDLIFVNALSSELQSSVSAFTNDNAFIDAMTTHAIGQELQTMWGFVAGSTDVNKCYSQLWGGTKKIFGMLKVLDGESVLYQSDPLVPATWLEYQVAAVSIINLTVSGVYINKPKVFTNNYTQFNTYLNTVKSGLRVLIEVADAQCTASQTQCVPDQNGIYNSVSECLESQLCPTSISGTNMGCNQVANANPTNVITGQSPTTVFYPNNDHCLWCSNYNGGVSTDPSLAQFGFDKTGTLNVSALYAPIQASNPVNLIIQVRSVTADLPPAAPGYMIYANYDPANDKLYPGFYYVTILDTGNQLNGGTSSSPICLQTILVSVGAEDANAKLDSGGFPTVEWGNNLGMPFSNFIPDSAVTIDDTNNTVTFNLNAVNGTYSIGMLDSSGSPADIPQSGVTQYTTNTLPPDTYMAIITVDAGNANAGAKATVRNIVIT